LATLRQTPELTIGELRFLARMIQAADDPTYLTAFNRGLAHIFQAQYPAGGWPQYYPPGTKYHRYITFNDHCTVNILEFLLVRHLGRESVDQRLSGLESAPETVARPHFQKIPHLFPRLPAVFG
jgi:PelA/Pel-15E family pectate lyase